MKKLNTTLLSFCLLNLSMAAFSQQKINTKLAAQIDSLKAEDQKPGKLPAADAPAAFQLAIHHNFPLVTKIFDTYGFPSIKMVGKESWHN